MSFASGSLCAPAALRRGTFGFDVNFEPHVARHGVEEIEVEELFRGQLFIRRVRDTYTVLGSTATGRRLFVVVARRERGIVRPITAREMTAMERRLFERKAR